MLNITIKSSRGAHINNKNGDSVNAFICAPCVHKIWSPKKNKAKKIPVVKHVESTTSESETISLADSDLSMGSFGDVDGTAAKRNEPMSLLDDYCVKEGDYALIKCDTNAYFAGKILTVVSSSDFDCTFMRKTTNCFVFPLIEDISQISRSEIFAILPQPRQMAGTSSMASRFIFDIDLKNLNVR